MSEAVVKQRRLATVYLCVRSTLVFNIVFDYLFVGVLANRVYIITLCPELSTPQFLLDFGMLFKDLLGRDAFDCSHEMGGWEVRNGLYEEMHMVFVCSHLVESYLVSLFDAEAHVLQRLNHFCGEYVPSVFHRADQMVQEERFVVTLQDVFAHQPILAPNAPAAELRGNLFEYINCFYNDVNGDRHHFSFLHQQWD